MTLSGLLWKSQMFLLSRLNPSFSGWPSLGAFTYNNGNAGLHVLIPLLVDDPLWDLYEEQQNKSYENSLNPSFSGWPSLGSSWSEVRNGSMISLNPSFSGWPSLGDMISLGWNATAAQVLIPLLVDDPLWAIVSKMRRLDMLGLNPSFSGWPSLGVTFKQ